MTLNTNNKAQLTTNNKGENHLATKPEELSKSQVSKQKSDELLHLTRDTNRANVILRDTPLSQAEAELTLAISQSLSEMIKVPKRSGTPGKPLTAEASQSVHILQQNLQSVLTTDTELPTEHFHLILRLIKALDTTIMIGISLNSNEIGHINCLNNAFAKKSVPFSPLTETELGRISSLKQTLESNTMYDEPLPKEVAERMAALKHALEMAMKIPALKKEPLSGEDLILCTGLKSALETYAVKVTKQSEEVSRLNHLKHLLEQAVRMGPKLSPEERTHMSNLKTTFGATGNSPLSTNKDIGSVDSLITLLEFRLMPDAPLSRDEVIRTSALKQATEMAMTLPIGNNKGQALIGKFLDCVNALETALIKITINSVPLSSEERNLINDVKKALQTIKSKNLKLTGVEYEVSGYLTNELSLKERKSIKGSPLSQVEYYSLSLLKKSFGPRISREAPLSHAEDQRAKHLADAMDPNSDIRKT